MVSHADEGRLPNLPVDASQQMPPEGYGPPEGNMMAPYGGFAMDGIPLMLATYVRSQNKPVTEEELCEEIKNMYKDLRKPDGSMYMGNLEGAVQGSLYSSGFFEKLPDGTWTLKEEQIRLYERERQFQGHDTLPGGAKGAPHGPYRGKVEPSGMGPRGELRPPYEKYPGENAPRGEGVPGWSMMPPPPGGKGEPQQYSPPMLAPMSPNDGNDVQFGPEGYEPMKPGLAGRYGNESGENATYYAFTHTMICLHCVCSSFCLSQSRLLHCGFLSYLCLCSPTWNHLFFGYRSDILGPEWTVAERGGAMPRWATLLWPRPRNFYLMSGSRDFLFPPEMTISAEAAHFVTATRLAAWLQSCDLDPKIRIIAPQNGCGHIHLSVNRELFGGKAQAYRLVVRPMEISVIGSDPAGE